MIAESPQADLEANDGDRGILDDNGQLAYRASLLDLMESLTLDSRTHLR
jgi:hypothetical protein